MSSIDDAIDQLEESAEKIRKILVDESKAIRDAVKKASKEATDRVKAEYAARKKEAKKEAKEAEKAIKDAQSRIQKALNMEQSASPKKRAKKGERDKHFLTFVKANPDSKLADIARGIGIKSASANGVAKRLVEQRKVKKSAQKTYRVAWAAGATEMKRRPLSKVISKVGRQRWKEIEGELPRLLEELWNAPGAPRKEHEHPVPTEPGLYLFLEEGDTPVYVGQTRNLNSRLGSHCRDSGGHNAVSFAFLRAKKLYEKRYGRWHGTRKELEDEPEFADLFEKAKKGVSGMEVRFCLCDDPELRTVFEVYAAELLDTKEFNSFETH